MKKIKFRSKLEEYCYNQLVKAELPFEYEPGRVILAPGFVYEGFCFERVGKKIQETSKRKQQAITYTPDFVGNGWVIETKGFERPIFAAKWKLYKAWLNKAEVKIDLYKPHNRLEVDECIEIIKKRNEKKN